MRRGFSRAFLGALALLGAWHGSAFAQTPLGINAATQSWPNRSIRAIIPFAAGSATDIIPRVVFEPLSVALHQPIVVENRGGGGTAIGAGMVAKSDPDGHTLLATSSAHTIVPTVFPNALYDTAKDFAAVVSFGSTPNVLIVSPKKGYRTAADLVAAAKAKTGSFNFSSAGVGSATHLSAERFRIAAGFTAVHIPFRGGPEALTEVLSGRSDFYFCPLGTALPYIQSGEVVPLAVSSPGRATLLPNVPSVLELYPNSDFPFWIGAFMPVKTPRNIVQAFHDETIKVMEIPAVKERLTSLGMEPMPLSPEDFDAHVHAEIISTGLLAKVVKLAPN